MLGQALKKYFSSGAVGFIGTGIMGGPMAMNLAKGGYTVYPYDMKEENLTKLQDPNIKLVNNIQKITENCDRIICMLPNGHSSNVVFDAITKHARPGTIIFESSTIEPSLAKEHAKNAEALGLTYIDGPVSGGVTGATAATLTFMVGSEENKNVQALRPLLQLMGKNILICGGSGNGQIAKMCNNLALSIQMASISEAMFLGKRSGIDPKILHNIMSVSSARCWSIDTYSPVKGMLDNVPASREQMIYYSYQGGFACALMAKDLGIAKATAESLGLHLPAFELMHQTYDKLSKNEYSNKDFGVIYKNLEESHKKEN